MSTGAGAPAPKKLPVNDPLYVKGLTSLLGQAKWLLKHAFKEHMELGKGLLVRLWFFVCDRFLYASCT